MVMDGSCNLNQGNSGHHLKLFVSADRNAGLPLTALDTAHNKTAVTAYNTLLNAGYTVATSFQSPSAYQDLNAGAGSGTQYNYLGYKSALAAVDSSVLRSTYAAAKERYENGGSAYSGLSASLTAAAAILADLNDGYTSRSQAQIDAAADAI